MVGPVSYPQSILPSNLPAASENLHNLRAHIPYFTLQHFIIYPAFYYSLIHTTSLKAVLFSLYNTLGSHTRLFKTHILFSRPHPKDYALVGLWLRQGICILTASLPSPPP